MKHKWQDNINLYEHQRSNRVLEKGKHFLLRLWHRWWCPLSHIKEWILLMTTILWSADVISHSVHWDTIRKWQMMVTTKKTSVGLSLVSWLRSFRVKGNTKRFSKKYCLFEIKQCRKTPSKSTHAFWYLP